MSDVEPPLVNPLPPENMVGQPISPPQPTTQIEAPVLPPPPVMPVSPPSASSPRGALFWSLMGSVATIVFVGAGFYLYGMFLSGKAPAPAPESLQPAMRECGSDASCVASAVAACAPARGTVSVDDPLSFVVARSVTDIAVTGAKNDLSCGVLITQNSSAAALPDSFFEAAKIAEAEQGAVIEQFAKDNAEPNALLDALTGQDALCSFSSVGAGALVTQITRSREIEYSTSIDATTGTGTPVTVAKIGGVPVDVDFWRECSGALAENRPKALEAAAALVKVQ